MSAALNAPDVRTTLIDARRSVAIAKLSEFEFQSWRIAGLVSIEIITQADAADFLREIALTNNLIDIHGEDLIQTMIADAFNSGGENGTR